MADYLDRILETKRVEVAQLKARKTMNELRAAAEKLSLIHISEPTRPY